MIASVLLALAPLHAPPQDVRQDVPQAEIDTAIDRGAAFLAEVFAPEEARRARKRKAPKERIGLRALALYTLLHCGKPHEDPAVERLVTGIGLESIDQTYDAACAILALAKHDAIAHRPRIDELARLIVGWQETGGEWGYPGLIVDLSNTQYAALGLWAAARCGFEVEPAVWSRLAEALFRFQSSDGGFGYTPGGAAGTGSMTSAGVGTLALCEIHLRLADALAPELEARIEAGRRAGLEWLAERFSVETNPQSGAWLYYYLYGLERMGALTGARELGEHDWYQAGARYLLDEQEEDGAWLSGTDLSDTCFALLFLKRATTGESRPRQPLTGGGKRVEREGEAAGPFTIAAEGRGPVTLQVAAFDPRAAATLEHEGERGLGPRIERVEYFADGKRVGVVLGDGGEPRANAPFASVWVPGRAGERELRAKAWVRPRAGSELVELESAPLTVAVERALPAWLDAAGRDLGRNAGPGFRAGASASSSHSKDELLGLIDFEPELAVDGLLGTSWLAEPDDGKRALKLTWRKPAEIDRIRVWPATWPARPRGLLTRPASIELSIPGGETFRATLAEGEPALFELDEPQRLRRLDLCITEVEEGEHAAVGIAEVELFRAEE